MIFAFRDVNLHRAHVNIFRPETNKFAHSDPGRIKQRDDCLISDFCGCIYQLFNIPKAEYFRKFNIKLHPWNSFLIPGNMKYMNIKETQRRIIKVTGRWLYAGPTFFQNEVPRILKCEFLHRFISGPLHKALDVLDICFCSMSGSIPYQAFFPDFFVVFFIHK